MGQKQFTHQVGDRTFTSTVSMARAKEMAAENIEAAFTDGDWSPDVLTYRGRIVLVIRTLDGYQVSTPNLSHGPNDEEYTGTFLAPAAYKTRVEAFHEAALSIIKECWYYDLGFVLPAMLPDAMTEKYIQWVVQEMRYINLTREGFSDGEANRYSRAQEVPPVIAELRDRNIPSVHLLIVRAE